jgi:hypothetical protein
MANALNRQVHWGAIFVSGPNHHFEPSFRHASLRWEPATGLSNPNLQTMMKKPPQKLLPTPLNCPG